VTLTFNVVCKTHGSGVSHRRHCPLCMADIAKVMADRVRNGEMLREVGDSYGLTAERVRQIVKAVDPSATKVGRAIRLERGRVHREVERAKRIAANPSCDICWGPITNRVIRKPGKLIVTCSTRCYELSRIVRIHLSEQLHEAHRLYMARSRVAHPERVRPADLHWAERVLAGTARRYRKAGPISQNVKAALDEVERLRVANTPRSMDVAS
jgi:hypothetical protein